MKEIETQIIGTVIRHSDELLHENWNSIAEMLKEVPDGKINIGLAVALDWSEASPKVKTVISYSRKWKDEREDELEDPNQERLAFGGVAVTARDTEMNFGQEPPEATPGDATPPQSDIEPGPDTNLPPEANGEPRPKRGRKSKVS